MITPVDLSWHNGRRLKFESVSATERMQVWHTPAGEEWFRLVRDLDPRTPVEQRWQVAYCASSLIGIGSTAQTALDDLRGRMLDARKSLSDALGMSL